MLPGRPFRSMDELVGAQRFMGEIAQPSLAEARAPYPRWAARRCADGGRGDHRVGPLALGGTPGRGGGILGIAGRRRRRASPAAAVAPIHHLHMEPHRLATDDIITPAIVIGIAAPVPARASERLDPSRAWCVDHRF